MPGLQGPAGLAGTTGTQGPAGPQGTQGPQGPCCSTNSSTSAAGLYSLSDQSLLLGSSVFFENISLTTPTDFDLSLASTTGQITFLKSGIYSIIWRADGLLTPPFPFPVTEWSLALYLDGLPIPGSCFSGFSLFPEEFSTNSSTNILLFITAGQVLTLQSTTILPISLIASSAGSITTAISASLTITKE